MSEGTSKVIEQLYNSDELLTEIRIQHKTPIDWRKKTVVVVRCTAQWFADLTSLRAKALKALEKVTFRPETGRTKLESLLTKRGEWCISRQRKWGVPIPVVYDAKTDEPLLNVENMEHIESVLQKEGLDYWWKGEAEEFVKPSLRRDGVTWRKGEDIIDVWFDSGCSWNVLPDSDAVLDDGAGSGVRQPLADVYFEGTDQHRGWFQSSLLTYIALNGSDENPSAPFKQVLTHGFTLDKKKQKLSKSLGNYKSPDFFISGGAKKNDVAYGTDAVRFWTARGDPTKDIIVSSLVIKHASEAQRKIRTTCRFLLSQLGLPHNNPSLQGQKLGIVERYMLNELYKLEKTCRAAYEAYDPPTIAAGLLNFCSLTVSTQYIPFTKDALYADAIESPRRQAIVAVYDQTLRTLLSIMAPIMPHLAEEIFHYYGGATKDPEMASTMNEDSEVPPPSLFVHGWQSVAEEYKDEAAEREFEVILKIRRSAFATLEQGRQLRKMKESREADIHILTSGVDEKDRDVLEILMSNRDDLPEILSLAHVKFVEVLPDVNEKDDEGIDGKAHWSLDGQMDGIRYRLQPSTQHRCPRCWNYRKEEHKEICGRCEEAMRSV